MEQPETYTGLVVGQGGHHTTASSPHYDWLPFSPSADWPPVGLDYFIFPWPLGNICHELFTTNMESTLSHHDIQVSRSIRVVSSLYCYMTVKHGHYATQIGQSWRLFTQNASVVY